jgi:hypothetical protein
VFVVLAVAGISMGFQELRTAAAIEASRIFMKNCSLSGCHQGQYPLSSVRIQNIKNWVDRGAKDN